MTSRLNDSLIDKLVKNCETADDVLGDNGVVKEITKRLLERMLNAEPQLIWVMKRTSHPKKKTMTVAMDTVLKLFLSKMKK